MRGREKCWGRHRFGLQNPPATFGCSAFFWAPFLFRGRQRRGHHTAARSEFTGVENYIVAFAVAVGAGGAEAEVGGYEHEGEFGEFSAALVVDFALAGEFWGQAAFGRAWFAQASLGQASFAQACGATLKGVGAKSSSGTWSEKRKGSGFLACASVFTLYICYSNLIRVNRERILDLLSVRLLGVRGICSSLGS